MPKQRRENLDPFNLSSLEEDILTLLEHAELYSYQISRAYEKAIGSELTVGSVYPTLRRLEKRGYVQGRWGDETAEERAGARRRYYKITGQGQRALGLVRERRCLLVGAAKQLVLHTG